MPELGANTHRGGTRVPDADRTKARSRRGEGEREARFGPLVAWLDERAGQWQLGVDGEGRIEVRRRGLWTSPPLGAPLLSGCGGGGGSATQAPARDDPCLNAPFEWSTAQLQPTVSTYSGHKARVPSPERRLRCRLRQETWRAPRQAVSLAGCTTAGGPDANEARDQRFGQCGIGGLGVRGGGATPAGVSTGAHRERSYDGDASPAIGCPTRGRQQASPFAAASTVAQKRSAGDPSSPLSATGAAQTLTAVAPARYHHHIHTRLLRALTPM